MKTKHITLLFIAPLLLIAALTSCSKTASLSDAVALRIIQQSGGLSVVPISVSNVKKETPLGQELGRLVSDGFLTQQQSYMAGCDATAKGAGMVGHCAWNSMYGEWDAATFFGLQPTPTKITSKLIDSKSGTAIIQYQVSWTRTDYLTKLCQLDPNGLGVIVSQQIGQMRTDGQISLKLWDDGWHPQ